MPTISVTKCQGTGNDFIILDARGEPALPYPALAVTLCSRRYSIGADGLLVVGQPRDRQATVAMRTFNADGSEAEMCGNGVRCVARYLYEGDVRSRRCMIETVAGLISTTIVDWQGGIGVQVEMNVPRLPSGMTSGGATRIGIGGEHALLYPVTVGNPHIVIFTALDPFACDLAQAADAAIAANAGGEDNVELVKVVDSGLLMRVLERGAGETWACGTGACAAAAAAIATGRCHSPVLVHSKGGVVSVAWDGPGSPAVLTGDAQLVFRTQIDVAAGAPTQVPL